MKFRNFFDLSQSPILNAVKSKAKSQPKESREERLSRIKAQEKSKYKEALNSVRDTHRQELLTRMDVLAQKLEAFQLQEFRNSGNALSKKAEENEEALSAIASEAEELDQLLYELDTSNEDVNPYVSDLEDGWGESTSKPNVGANKKHRKFVREANALLKKNNLLQLDEVAEKNLEDSPNGIVLVQVRLYKEALNFLYHYLLEEELETKEISKALKILDKKEEEKEEGRQPVSKPLSPEEEVDNEPKKKTSSKKKQKRETTSAPSEIPEDLS